jgi:hypothetical protein
MRRIASSLLTLAVAALSFAAPALAGTATFPGTWEVGGPTMPVVAISTPNCTAQLATPVRYKEHPFHVTVSGIYNFSETVVPNTPGNLASLYVMSENFDPAAGLATCLFASNNGSPPATPTTLAANLTAFTPYIAVAFDDTFAQSGESYVLTVSGPGDILVFEAPSILEIPTLSPWGLALLAALLALGGLALVRRSRLA